MIQKKLYADGDRKIIIIVYKYVITHQMYMLRAIHTMKD